MRSVLPRAFAFPAEIGAAAGAAAVCDGGKGAVVGARAAIGFGGKLWCSGFGAMLVCTCGGALGTVAVGVLALEDDEVDVAVSALPPCTDAGAFCEPAAALPRGGRVTSDELR